LWTIKRLVKRFRAEGSVGRKAYQRERTARSSRIVRKIARVIRLRPKQSTRKLARDTGVKRTTVRRILKDNLGLFPYKLQLIQRLKRGDHTKRLTWCRWLLQKVTEQHDFLDNLWMTGEAHFSLDGEVGKQNCRWRRKIPTSPCREKSILLT